MLQKAGAIPEIDLSPQVLVNCVTAGGSMGCRGGDPTAAYAWIKQNGVVDESCQNYLAKDHKCDAMGTCVNCQRGKGCFAMPESSFKRYEIESHGTVQGEEAMMAEITKNGPIGCGLCVTPEFESYKSGVFKDTSGCKEQDHEISITGFGVDKNGTKFWIGRNSWGTYWVSIWSFQTVTNICFSQCFSPRQYPLYPFMQKTDATLCHLLLLFMNCI